MEHFIRFVDDGDTLIQATRSVPPGAPTGQILAWLQHYIDEPLGAVPMARKVVSVSRMGGC